ncbi:MAG: LysR family transcriptional regulator [Xanthobacteraceae bacterium]|jgi:DNA-binding transcriptional LysR family regulator
MYRMSAMHLRDLDITQISLLAELSRSRSVSRAAQRIGVSQSAASHALAKLRKILGDPLFTRTRDGFQPTPFGARLCEASCEAVDVLVAGLASSDRFDPLTTTRVFRFFMNDVGQTVLLPRLLHLLKRKAPGASARVLPVPLDNPGAALSAGEVDFAIGFFNNLTTGCVQSLVFRDRYACIVRAGHPKFRAGMSLEAFKSAEHAVADATGMAHAVIDRFLAKHRVRRNVTLRVPGLHVLPMIVANSDLVAVVPARLADVFASRVPIKVLPPPVAMAQFDVCIHWHERYHHDPGIRWMRRAFVDLFARERR